MITKEQVIRHSYLEIISLDLPRETPLTISEGALYAINSEGEIHSTQFYIGKNGGFYFYVNGIKCNLPYDKYLGSSITLNKHIFMWDHNATDVLNDLVTTHKDRAAEYKRLAERSEKLYKSYQAALANNPEITI